MLCGSKLSSAFGDQYGCLTRDSQPLKHSFLIVHRGNPIRLFQQRLSKAKRLADEVIVKTVNYDLFEEVCFQRRYGILASN